MTRKTWVLMASAVALPGMALAWMKYLGDDDKRLGFVLVMVVYWVAVLLVFQLPRLLEWWMWRGIEREARKNRGLR